jgi:hypothetical protein
MKDMNGLFGRFILLGLALCMAAPLLFGQAQAQVPANPAIPDWAYPGTATRKQVPPPAGFCRVGG